MSINELEEEINAFSKGVCVEDLKEKQKKNTKCRVQPNTKRTLNWIPGFRGILQKHLAFSYTRHIEFVEVKRILSAGCV